MFTKYYLKARLRCATKYFVETSYIQFISSNSYCEAERRAAENKGSCCLDLSGRGESFQRYRRRAPKLRCPRKLISEGNIFTSVQARADNRQQSRAVRTRLRLDQVPRAGCRRGGEHRAEIATCNENLESVDISIHCISSSLFIIFVDTKKCSLVRTGALVQPRPKYPLSEL